MFKPRPYIVWIKGDPDPVRVKAKSAVVLDDRTLVFYRGFLNECAAFKPEIWEWYQEEPTKIP